MIDIRNCDNLELLAEMPNSSIDLIYSDILYGTGRDFGDYQDLKPVRSIIEAHYIPRIKEMHRVLKQTGSIYLQMDSKISHWLRCILDDIFSYSNFRSEISIQRFSQSMNKTKRIKNYNVNKDIILFLH
jgi:site-specific DNA-methyltransferase (adenine-specific)